MTEGLASIEVERHIHARPDTIFSYFTDAERYTRWMGVEATLDARPGGIYRVLTPRGDVARGEFLEVEPPRRVVFTWGWEHSEALPPGSSTVEVIIEPGTDHTVVRLVHSGLPVGALDLHRAGWERYLGRLAVTSEGGEPGPDAA